MVINRKLPHTLHAFEPTRFYGVTDASRVLGISRVAILKRITSGKLRAERVGRSYVIRGADLAALVLERKHQEPAVDEKLAPFARLFPHVPHDELPEASRRYEEYLGLLLRIVNRRRGQTGGREVQ